MPENCMRKSILLLAILLLLGVGTVCYAQNEILKEKDQVHFKETVIYGEKSIAEGIEITMNNWYEKYLSWTSTYKIGENPSVDTDYNYYPLGEVDTDYAYSGSIVFRSDANEMQNLDWRSMNETDNSAHTEGLERALWELYEQTEPGEEQEMMVRIKDYVDYYTFSVDFNGPFDTTKQDEQISFYLNKKELLAPIVYGYQVGTPKQETIVAEKYLDYLETFQEFFKIPVIENEVYKLVMEKNSLGDVTGFGGASSGSGFSEGSLSHIPGGVGGYMPELTDSFWFDVYSVVEKGHCYFTFDAHTENGKLVDTSEIPGGYGIYHLPYDVEKQEIYPEELEMVYALDPSIKIDLIFIDICEKNLILMTTEENEETDYMYVIDRETMTLREKFEVGSTTIGRMSSFRFYEDYMVITTETGIRVFTIDENGNYTFQYFTPTDVLGNLKIGHIAFRDIPSPDITYAWDGEKLVFSSYLYSTYWINGELSLHWANPEPSFYLAVMDETGLLYLGSYESSLRTPDVHTDNYSVCGPHRKNAIEIRLP